MLNQDPFSLGMRLRQKKRGSRFDFLVCMHIATSLPVLAGTCDELDTEFSLLVLQCVDDKSSLEP